VGEGGRGRGGGGVVGKGEGMMCGIPHIFGCTGFWTS
jgi:hypothetical protein